MKKIFLFFVFLLPLFFFSSQDVSAQSNSRRYAILYFNTNKAPETRLFKTQQECETVRSLMSGSAGFGGSNCTGDYQDTKTFLRDGTLAKLAGSGRVNTSDVSALDKKYITESITIGEEGGRITVTREDDSGRKNTLYVDKPTDSVDQGPQSNLWCTTLFQYSKVADESVEYEMCYVGKVSCENSIGSTSNYSCNTSSFTTMAEFCATQKDVSDHPQCSSSGPSGNISNPGEIKNPGEITNPGEIKNPNLSEGVEKNNSTPVKFSVTLTNPLGKNVTNINQLIARLITIALDLGLIVASLAILYSGFLFVKAQGDSKKITEAKNRLQWSVIGLAILLSASIITQIVKSTIESLSK